MDLQTLLEKNKKAKELKAKEAEKKVDSKKEIEQKNKKTKKTKKPQERVYMVVEDIENVNEEVLNSEDNTAVDTTIIEEE